MAYYVVVYQLTLDHATISVIHASYWVWSGFACDVWLDIKMSIEAHSQNLHALPCSYVVQLYLLILVLSSCIDTVLIHSFMPI